MLGSLVYAVFGFIELLVGLRFIFLLLGANSISPFVNWIYTWSEPLVVPFSGIFGQHAFVTSAGVVVHSVLDWTTLIALIIYAAIGGILGRLLGAI